jgi:carbon-monoxide dehydrogenase large subunit
MSQIAAHMLGADASSVLFREGRFSKEAAKAAAAGAVPEPDVPVGQAPAGALPEPNTDDKQISVQDIALAAHIAREIPPGMEPGLSATYFFEPENFTFPFGTHICVVEIDKDTGDIHLQKYVAVDDCGKQINPLLVEGQIHGGIVQSIGQALYEEVVYDENGQLMTGTLMDYALPKAAMIPHLELDSTETPSPVNPLGAKGVGEAGTIGATPAIVGAVVDALSPYGVRHLDMPLRP